MLKLQGCLGMGWGVHGTNEESGGLGAGWEGVCQGMSHRESLGMPELDMKPQLPHPWSLFETLSATSALASVPLSQQGLLCQVLLRLSPVCSQWLWGAPLSACAIRPCSWYLLLGWESVGALPPECPVCLMMNTPAQPHVCWAPLGDSWDEWPRSW